MEMNKPEVVAVLAAIGKVEEVVRELDELELTLAAGGVGEVILA